MTLSNDINLTGLTRSSAEKRDAPRTQLSDVSKLKVSRRQDSRSSRLKGLTAVHVFASQSSSKSRIIFG